MFPPQVARDSQNGLIPKVTNVPHVTEEEVFRTLTRIKDNKAPGPDGIPNIAFKEAIRSTPTIFSDLYTACLTEGEFPTRWKIQRLVLLLKPGKQPNLPSSYRPLCMLDTVGKVLERIICERLREHLEGPTGLSDNQFGFRKARSTVDAIRTVVEIAQRAISAGRSARKFCAVITLDVKNAFNSAYWPSIITALKGFNVPAYLVRIISSYLSDRILRYDTDNGQKTYKVSGGVPQGSVMGPTLWNVMYDAVLKVKLPADAEIVGYADDIALVVVDRKLGHLKEKCNDAAARVQRWLNEAKLELAVQKTEAVLISAGGRKSIELNIGSHQIISKKAIKYLGVWIDTKLCFRQHLINASSKAASVNGALARLLPNIHGGPQGKRRRLLSLVADSIILYAAPIWAGTKKSNLREVTQTHRQGALRVACAYRTVSDDAICVIAGKLPLDLLADETKRLYNVQGARPTPEQKAAERLLTVDRWQQRWDKSQNGRWTYKLIPRVVEWLGRKHGDIDYHLSQLLSGHGCFRKYLHRFKLADNPFCPKCPNTDESAEHVIFHCDRFREERGILEQALGHQPSPSTLIGDMCATSSKWEAAQTFAAKIMTRLRHIDWERKAMQQQLQQQ